MLWHAAVYLHPEFCRLDTDEDGRFLACTVSKGHSLAAEDNTTCLLPIIVSRKKKDSFLSDVSINDSL